MVSRKGATLTLAKVAARRLGVIARTGPRSGKVALYVGSRRVGVVDLHSDQPRHRRLILLAATAPVHGQLRLVATSAKRVAVDGVLVIT